MENERRLEYSSSVEERYNPSKMTRENWEVVCLRGSLTYYPVLLYRNGPANDIPLEEMDPSSPDWETGVLKNFYRIERRFDQNPDRAIPSGYIQAKRRYLRDLSRDIRRNKRYYVIPRLVKRLDDMQDRGLPVKAQVLLMNDLVALYLMVCDSNRFLVGTYDGVYWKDTNWPDEEMSARDIALKANSLASTYLRPMEQIGKDDLDLVPDEPLPLGEVGSMPVRIPKPAREIDELLEDAYYNQRYIIPPEGAEVRFRNAGDLRRVIIKQIGPYIAGRVVTDKGDELIELDPRDGMVTDSRLGPHNREVVESLGGVLAEVYHDMVTAIELPVNRQKVLGSRHTMSGPEGEVEMNDEVQVTYIPRIVRVGEDSIRLPYERSGRPVRPHRVSGHKRRANMTEKHRQALLEFERQYGIKILENLPTGYTFVRPFISPTGFEGNFANLPVFIKRRIQTQIEQELQEKN